MIKVLWERMTRWISNLELVFRPIPAFLKQLRQVEDTRERINHALSDLENVTPDELNADPLAIETTKAIRQSLEESLITLNEIEASVRERISVNEQFYHDIYKEYPKLSINLGKSWIAIKQDPVLFVASVISFFGAVISLIVIAPQFWLYLSSIWRMVIPNAFGAGGETSPVLTAKDGLKFFILAVVSIGFFFALGLSAFSNKDDARKIGADMIKTILGFYLGIATKLIE